MKRFSAFMLSLLILMSLLCSAASAEVITALATEINPEHLEKTSSYARILGYSEKENTLAVELIVPEVFPGQDVLALKPGDSIYTGGREVKIESIAYDDEWCGTVFINGNDLFLFQDRSGNYTMMADEDDCVWNAIAVIECPVKESLLFLDHIDDSTGDPLELPVVHTARELTARLLEEGADQVYTVGLATHNVYVVFDGEGNLAVIARYYVPWQ